MTHYLEDMQVRMLLPIRNLIYFGSTSDTEVQDGALRTKYRNESVSHFNPVKLSNSVNGAAKTILENGGDESVKGKCLVGDSDRKKVVDAASFFVGYGVMEKWDTLDYFLLPYNFDLKTYDKTLVAPWYSGMAQGNAIITLLAAYRITDDVKYLNYAKLVANALFVPVENKGVSIYLDSNRVWFEEYAGTSLEPPRVLNGHIFALFGLHKLIQFDSSYTGLFQKGVSAVEMELPKYNALVWSRYDLAKFAANPKYHRIHIGQLERLGEITGSAVFLRYAGIFKVHRIVPLGIFYRLIFHPSRFLLIITLMNIAFVFVGIQIFALARKTGKHK